MRKKGADTVRKRQVSTSATTFSMSRGCHLQNLKGKLVVLHGVKGLKAGKQYGSGQQGNGGLAKWREGHIWFSSRSYVKNNSPTFVSSYEVEILNVKPSWSISF